MQRNIRVRN